MRTRRNETVAEAAAGLESLSPSGKGRGEEPVRSCILTRGRGARGSLVRLALASDGAVLPDVRAKAPGRGAWIGVTQTDLETAIAKGKLKGALARAFKGAAFTLAADLPGTIAAALERNALDRLGLEARSGTLATGAERIETAARSGQLHALYHAADAGADGTGKLAQAWRVGREEEGSGLKGLTLPVPRAILSLALGRENVVHIGVTDRAAARRVSEALDRWLHFIGPASLSLPCETAAQGASAPASASKQLAPGPLAMERTEESE
ncbi:DUF448 domain-containing protein [Sphingomonas sp.]|uniref:DUF448 domain-containing protein n=1 Tax=Sphingomonas sp. TaxID=28214 RepID=UPI003CC5FE56